MHLCTVVLSPLLITAGTIYGGRYSWRYADLEINYWLTVATVSVFQSECQNHIRIVSRLPTKQLLVCGTHAYRPKCRHYIFKVSRN